MKNLLILILTLFFLFAFKNETLAIGGGDWVDPPAGMPSCAGQDAPGNTACIATPICDLNGYCGTTSSSYGANTWSQLTSAFCGSIENNAFLSFTAINSSISFDAYVYNCYDDEAIQVFIFSAASCNSGPVTAHVCVNEMYAQNSTYNVSASGLIPGNQYYIMIDGFGGDVCDYTFVATSGVATPVSSQGAEVSIDPSNNYTLCEGGSLTVTASGGYGGYAWSGDPGLGGTTGTTVVITPPSTPGVYNYHIESTGMQGMCPGSEDYDFTITVVPANQPTLSSTDPTCNACDGTVSASMSGATFSWEDINGTALGNTSSLSNLCAGSYIVTTSYGGGSCNIIDTISIFAPGADDPSFNFANFCIESSNGPTGIVSSGGSFSFNPVPSDGATINSSTGVISNPTVGTTYTVEHTTTGVCPQTSSQNVTANGFTISSNSTNANCGAADGSITVTPTGNGSTYNYSLNGGTSQTSGNFANLSAGSYSISVTDNNGCTATGSASIGNIGAPYFEAPQDASICLGQNVTLTANNPNGATITWDNGITDGVAFTPSSAGTTVYTVTATASNGCDTTATVSVTVYDNPTPSFTADVTKGCNPLTVTFTDNSGITSTDCLWDLGDGNSSTDCNSVTHVYDQSGTYTVTLTITDNNTCSGTASQTNYIEVIDAVVANFTANPMETTTKDPEVDFTNASSNATDYIWDFGDGSSNSTDLNPTHLFPSDEPGTYIVTLYASNESCMDSAQVTINIIYPDPEYELPNVFTPNGDGDNDFFKFIYYNNIKKIDLVIVNRWGNAVFTSDKPDFNWNGKVNNSGGLCSEGVYFYKMTIYDFTDNEYPVHGFVHLAGK